MLKYLGLIMIALAGILVSREYEEKEKKRLFELREIIRLGEHIKRKISCFLAPKSDWLSGFKSDSAPISEFLSLSLKSSLSESFSSIKNRLSMGDEADIVERLFSSLGKGYKDGEIELLDIALAELCDVEKRLSQEALKNIKTVKVLAAAIALGLIILLI